MVQQYRVFFFDNVGRITHAHEFEARDDGRAVEIAEAWQEGRRMELWQRARKVRQWEAG